MAFERQLRKLWHRLRLMVSRGVVTRANAGAKLQALQVELLEGETADDVEHFEPYGLTAKPKAGAEAVAACVGADRSHVVVLSVSDRRYRIKNLGDGEVALYNDTGAVVHLKSDGSIAIVQNGAGQVHIGGDPASDFVALAQDVLTELNSIKTAFDSHTHPYNPGPGAVTPTSTPTAPMPAPGSVAATKVKAT